MYRHRKQFPALLVAAVFSRFPECFEWVQNRLQSEFGAVPLQSRIFSFHHTSYYEESMGAELQKQLLVFADLVPEDCLPVVKRKSIAMEQEMAQSRDWDVERPINIDPGLLTLGKFLLATTKDQAHRIYLRDGIYAEVTLRYQDHAFHPWPWTYADYRQPEYHEFLLHARRYYRQQLKAWEMKE